MKKFLIHDRRIKIILPIMITCVMYTIGASAENLINIQIKNPSNRYVFVASTIEEVKNNEIIINDVKKLKYNPNSFGATEVVKYATKFLGVPYLWGAEGPNRFDCSGYVKYIYHNFGVNLPRTSKEQSTFGTYIPKPNLKPGDLVFFGSPVHHVGMYVGEGMYIHAPKTHDVVKISALNGRSDYNCARRVK